MRPLHTARVLELLLKGRICFYVKWKCFSVKPRHIPDAIYPEMAFFQKGGVRHSWRIMNLSGTLVG